MRNLKRALSLAVASVMLLGMMVVGTGAGYADVTSEDNKEAIEVLQAVSVMVGDENGDFNPDANVTRNEMAVIMSNLMDYRVASYAGTAPFTDVPAWAEPYVAACYTHGIVYGTTATYYNGAATVNAAEAALMLMKALGYFQYQSDFEDDWQLATIRQASKIELYDGIEAGVVDPMTRNEVAQMVLNTLEATMVEADDSTINVSSGDTTVQAGKISYYNIYKSGNKYTVIDDADREGGKSAVQLGEQLYDGDLKKTEDTDDAFGRPGTKWVYDLDSIGTFTDEPIATYSAKASKGTLYSLVGKDRVKDLRDDAELSVYVDGKDADLTISNYFENKSSSAAGVSGKGVLTEVYMDDDGNITIVFVNTYLMKATADYSEKKESVNVSLVTNPGNINVNALNDEDFDVVDYSEDDYILYTAAFDGRNYSVETIAPATVVEGEVNAYSVENYVTLDGTKYEYAKKILGNKDDNDDVAIESAATEYVVTDNASVVVDAYGYVLYVDDASISAGNYLYMSKIAKASGLSSKIIADAYFTDGTNEEITLKKIKDEDLDDVTVDGEAATNTAYAGWYAYTKGSDGKYTLTVANTNGTKTPTSVLNNRVDFMGEGVKGEGVKGNANTVFIVKDDDDDVTVYTGIANVPDVTTGKAGQSIQVGYMRDKDTAGKVASLVFVDASSATVKSSTKDTMLYVLKLDSKYVDKANGETVNVYEVIMDGEETKIEAIVRLDVGEMYTDFSIDSDGYYEAAELFETDGDDVTYALDDETIAYSAGTLTMGSGVYTTDSDTKVILILKPASKTGDLAKDIMSDSGATYEVYTPSAKSMASMLKNYTLTGTVYAQLDDADDSDLVNTVYVVITAADEIED